VITARIPGAENRFFPQGTKPHRGGRITKLARGAEVVYRAIREDGEHSPYLGSEKDAKFWLDNVHG